MKRTNSHFKELYDTNYPKVMRLCLGYVKGDETLAKDLTQEVFIKVWTHLETFRQESSIYTWVYRITVNTCLASLRKKRKIATTHKFNYKEIAAEEIVYEAGEEDQLFTLYRCIDTLSEPNKTIILLELEGIRQKEIAAITGLSHQTIRVRIHRIKEKLTKCMTDDKF